MAGTVTLSYGATRVIKQVIWDWVSDASGDVNGTDTKAVSGELLSVVTNPGTAAPTANYDIVINDEDGFDIANGLLANRHTTTTETVNPLKDTVIGANTFASRPVFDGKLSLVITNAGNAKAGRIVLNYR